MIFGASAPIIVIKCYDIVSSLKLGTFFINIIKIVLIMSTNIIYSVTGMPWEVVGAEFNPIDCNGNCCESNSFIGGLDIYLCNKSIKNKSP